MQYVTLKKRSYAGGKAGAGIRHKIINQIPPHQIFIVGFLGQCAITRYKKPAQHTIAYELNQEVIKDWNKAKFNTSELRNDNLEIRNISFLEFNPFDDIFQNPNVYVYLDPPYPFECRSSKKDIYKFEMTDEQHIDLLKKLQYVKCKVGIQSYKNSIYSKYLKKWRFINYKSTTRNGTRTEYLYMNYEAPKQLHDYSYIGSNKRQREAIKRRFTTFKKRLAKMNPHEQLMYLEFVQNNYLKNEKQCPASGLEFTDTFMLSPPGVGG